MIVQLTQNICFTISLQSVWSGPENSNLFVWVFLRLSNTVMIFQHHFCTVSLLQEKVWIPNKMGPHRWHQKRQLPISQHQLQWSRKLYKGGSTSISGYNCTARCFLECFLRLRDQYGRDRQQYDMYASLVSIKRRPRIPLVSYSIFEVALVLRYLFVSCCIASMMDTHQTWWSMTMVVVAIHGTFFRSITDLLQKTQNWSKF